MFKCVNDNSQFTEDITKGRLARMRRMSRDAALVCVAFLGFKLDIDDDAEVVDMCNEFRRFERKCLKKGREEGLQEGFEKGHEEGLQEGLEEGRQEGRQEGLEEGRRETLIGIVKRLVKKGLSILEICDFTGASDETVREIILSFES